MAKALTGGCQCGAVRYRLEPMPEGANICHCRMCQKAGGGPFMAFVPAARDKFRVTRGAITAFVSSEIAERGFCPGCGTPLTYQGNGADHISVTIGSLDEPNAVTPNEQAGSEGRLKWLDAALKAPATRTEDWLASKNRKTAGSRQHPDRD